MRNLVFKSPYTIQHQLLGETGGGGGGGGGLYGLACCQTPRPKCSMYVLALLVKSAFRPEKKEEKIKSDGLA